MDNPDEDFYPCVGICTADPDSGYCLGCGRPPLASPVVVAEVVPPSTRPADKQNDQQAE